MCVCVCVCDGILLSYIKNEIVPFVATWMDLEIIILSEVSQKRQMSYDIIYMWNLKKNPKHTNKLIHKTETHSHSKQTYGYQRGKGWGETN